MRCHYFSLAPQIRIDYKNKNSAIVALGEFFNKELMDILYLEIQRKEISNLLEKLIHIAQLYTIDLIEIIRSLVRRIGGLLLIHLPTFANMILRAVDIAKDASGKLVIESVTLLIKTMLAVYPNVAFHQNTEVTSKNNIFSF